MKARYTFDLTYDGRKNVRTDKFFLKIILLIIS